jgi:pimeloyl-ACP methyl ester carboxylesterase
MSVAHIAHDACPATANGHAADELVQIETPPAVPLAAALDLWQDEARRGICDTGRYRMPYFVWGSGPPIVFVHGLADSSRAFIPVMAALRRQFTCIAYDLPTGGPDGARLGAYRHRHLVADLAALLDHLGYRQAHLFGSSFGSTIVLALLHARPGWTTRAVLQGGFAYRTLAPWERVLCRFARYWRGPLGTMPLRARLDHPSDLRVFQSTPDEFRFHRDNSDYLPKAAVARRGLMILDVDLRSRLPDIKQPVLLICGDCDRIVPAACEQPLLEGLPNVARVELPSCGHYPQYTHAPLVAEVVRQFLAAPICHLAPGQ